MFEVGVEGARREEHTGVRVARPVARELLARRGRGVAPPVAEPELLVLGADLARVLLLVLGALRARRGAAQRRVAGEERRAVAAVVRAAPALRPRASDVRALGERVCCSRGAKWTESEIAGEASVQSLSLKSRCRRRGAPPYRPTHRCGAQRTLAREPPRQPPPPSPTRPPPTRRHATFPALLKTFRGTGSVSRASTTRAPAPSRSPQRVGAKARTSSHKTV